MIRIFKIVWILFAFAVVFAVIFNLSASIAKVYQLSAYRRFISNDQKYYAELARACDLVITQHPCGTNDFIRISGTNSSLPQIMRNLGPQRITVSSNRVHMVVGVGRGFGISWEPQEGAQTNLWALNVFPEGPQRVVYVEMKP